MAIHVHLGGFGCGFEENVKSEENEADIWVSWTHWNFINVAYTLVLKCPQRRINVHIKSLAHLRTPIWSWLNDIWIYMQSLQNVCLRKMSPSLTQFVHALSLFFYVLCYYFWACDSDNLLYIFKDVSVEAFPGETNILENFKLIFSFACTQVRR